MHLGIDLLYIGLTGIGLAGPRGFASQGDLTLRQGPTGTIAACTFKMERMERISFDGSKMGVAVRIGVFPDGHRLPALRCRRPCAP